MKILVACEMSGRVRDAFIAKGHDAISCDILPSERPGPHYQGNVMDIINDGWDLMVGHPPCTYMSYAGIRWFNVARYGDKALERLKLKNEAIEFFLKLWNAPINKICLENPRGFITKVIKPTQMINPYYFGDSFSKPTLLWLKNLPRLVHSKEDDLFYKKTYVDKGEFVERMQENGKVKKDAKWYYEASRLPPKERAILRSRTFPGIANAMADQWG